MSDFLQENATNLLLRALPPKAYALLQPAMQRVELPLKFDLVIPDVATDLIYFLEQGLGSLVATNSDDESVEVGHIGYEGMTGSHVLLKVEETPNKAFMQVEGSVISVPTSVLLSVVEQVPTAHDLLLRYVHCCELQLAHSALSSSRYKHA